MTFLKRVNDYLFHREIHATDIPLFQMEVGIEDCLHIEFEYSKSK